MKLNELELEPVENLVTEVRSDPSKFPDEQSLVRACSHKARRAVEHFYSYYHSSPADILERARVTKAKDLLIDGTVRIPEIAARVGFGSVSDFSSSFQHYFGMSPREYRSLDRTTRFDLVLPRGYSLSNARYALSRDVVSINERLNADAYSIALVLNKKAIVLKMRLQPGKVSCSCPPDSALAAHSVAVRLLGLGQGVDKFERMTRRMGYARLVATAPGLRISQTPTVFDGLLWSIIGQQINFAFACRLRRRLFELCGQPAGEELIASPSPGAVASLEHKQLLPLQFSRQKADYIIAVSRLVANGELHLDNLGSLSAVRAERILLNIRGLGPWSVNYIMMRSLGFSDCVPLGDTGVTSGLKKLMNLEERPDKQSTLRLMTPFSPYRSLATSHLWQYDRSN